MLELVLIWIVAFMNTILATLFYLYRYSMYTVGLRIFRKFTDAKENELKFNRTILRNAKHLLCYPFHNTPYSSNLQFI